MKAKQNSPAAQVLGVQLDMTLALAHIAKALDRKVRGYFCVGGVHGVREASSSPFLSEIYAESEMTIPDGLPLVWVGRLQGHDAVRRVIGPDLMLEVFGRKEFANVTQDLYGGVKGVAEKLRSNLIQRFPWVRIAEHPRRPSPRSPSPKSRNSLQPSLNSNPTSSGLDVDVPG